MSPIPERLLATRAAQVADAAALLESLVGVGDDAPADLRERAIEMLEPLRSLERELRVGYGGRGPGVPCEVVVEVEGPGGGLVASEILRWDGVLADAPRPTIGGQRGSTIDPGGDAPALIAETVDLRLNGTAYVECQTVADPPGRPVGEVVKHLRAAGFRGYNEPQGGPTA
jgi:hypothetical protein